MYSAHHPTSYAHSANYGAPQPPYTDYKSGIAFATQYQPNPRTLHHSSRDRTAIFEAAFAQNPNGLRSEEEYRLLAAELNYSVATLKSRFTRARQRVQQRQEAGLEGLCKAARQALAEMD